MKAPPSALWRDGDLVLHARQCHGRHAMETDHLDRHRLRGHVPDLADRLSHTCSIKLCIVYMAGVVGLLVVMVSGLFPFGRQALDLFGRRSSISKCQSFMKLIIIIVLARYFSEVCTDRLTLSATALVKVGAFTLVPVAPILKQPDLGNGHGLAARGAGLARFLPASNGSTS